MNIFRRKKTVGASLPPVTDTPAMPQMMSNAIDNVGSAAVLPPAGRSSQHQEKTLFGGLQGYSNFFAGTSPATPFQYLRFLERVIYLNPTLNHGVMNWISIRAGDTLRPESRM